MRTGICGSFCWEIEAEGYAEFGLSIKLCKFWRIDRSLNYVPDGEGPDEERFVVWMDGAWSVRQ